jgi:O-antigen/teichoic acid export membrane protein
LLAQPLAQFYKQPEVQPVIRTLSVVFIINALVLIPSTIVYKKMNFRIISIFNVTAAAISGITGVALAYKGFGVWSLVAQTLISSLVLLLLYEFYTRWKPSISFRISKIKPLWSYGSRMFLATLSDNFFSRLDVFVIAKLFNVQTVGFYSRAQSLDQMVRQFSSTNIITVLFPHIATLQNNRKELKSLYIKYLHLIGFVSLGLSGILFVVAKPLFIALFTVKWLFAAELFKIMAITSFAYPVGALMCNIIAGVGNSKALLRLEVPKRIIMLIGFAVGFIWGIKGFLYAMIGVTLIGTMLNALAAGREIQLSSWAQWKVLIFYILTASISAFIAELILMSIQSPSPYFNIVMGVTTFSAVYILVNYLRKAKGLFDLADKLFSFKVFKTSLA